MAGALLGGGGSGLAAPSKAQDVKILKFVLDLERLQSAFYAAALKQAKLTGELKTFATTAADHERQHVAFVEKALGSAAQAKRSYDFGAATTSPAAFLKAAVTLEDLAVQAYNAGALGLTKPTLAAAAKIASVEARHAAWIRDLAKENPAPDAVEPAISTEQASAALNKTGYIR